MSEDKKLSPKQQAFVDAYIGECNLNGTKAAEKAGYAFPSVEASRLLANPKIKVRVNEHLDSIRDQGIANKAFRIAELNRLYSRVNNIIEDEGIYQEAYTNQGKQYKTFAKDVTNELRSIMEQAAKEVGDRDKRIQLDADVKVETTSAKDSLLTLIQEDSTSE